MRDVVVSFLHDQHYVLPKPMNYKAVYSQHCQSINPESSPQKVAHGHRVVMPMSRITQQEGYLSRSRNCLRLTGYDLCASANVKL